jgi:UDP-3-O-[3-hydroxymyristoyl] glucosamine N-acyltransferase
MINAQVILDLNSSDLQFISGSLEAVAAKVLPPELADNESLVFVSKPDQLESALKAKAPIIVAHRSIKLPESGATFFTAGSVQLGMAAIIPLFDGKMNRFSQPTKIHPTAVIHQTAHLEKGVGIGPFVVIGENVRIGEGTTIAAHTVVEADAVIGAHTLLHSQVFIGGHCVVGSHCEIHPHATIGADGFSFAPTREGTHKKIPQIGRVIIGDWVEIGANCTIDRAALTETRIGEGTKFDNLCHVGHNVEIGKHCVFAAGFMIAGSSKIGDNCMFGGSTMVTDHATICSGVIVAGKSGVTKDITVPGQYGGYPLEPLRDAMKTIANLAHLTRIRKETAKMMKHLGLKED